MPSVLHTLGTLMRNERYESDLLEATKSPEFQSLQAWMSALSSEILYEFQKSRFGHYTPCRHRINCALAEET